MDTTYLSEALYGNYEFGLEDRLTQIFSASFNHSPLFRRAIGDFFGCKRLLQSESITQTQYSVLKKPVKLDILLQTINETPLVAVENKVDAPFSPNQLKKYSRIPEITRCLKFCLVKQYKRATEIHHGWRVRYWRNFYVHLVSLPKSQTDFVIDNFIATLKEYGMDSPVVIKKVDLKRLAKALHSLRSEDKPEFPYNEPIFETLVDLKKLLVDLLRQAAKHPVLRKRAGKAFRSNIWVGHWWEGEKTKGRQLLWIGCDVQFKKRPYKELKGFGAALTLGSHSGDYDLCAYLTKTDETWRDDTMTYPKKDVNCSDFAEKAIGYWVRLLK
jgi:hypothetical protein